MRKLDKEHLTNITIILAIILAILFIPVLLSHVSIWLLKASDFSKPQMIEWGLWQDTPKDLLTIALIRWGNGIIKILWLGIISLAVAKLWFIGYVSLNYLFPKTETHKPYTPGDYPLASPILHLPTYIHYTLTTSALGRGIKCLLKNSNSSLGLPCFCFIGGIYGHSDAKTRPPKQPYLCQNRVGTFYRSYVIWLFLKLERPFLLPNLRVSL